MQTCLCTTDCHLGGFSLQVRGIPLLQQSSPGIIKLLWKGNISKSLWQPKTELKMLKAFVSPQAFCGHSTLPSRRKLCVSLVVPGLFLATETVLQNTLKAKVPHKTELYGVFSPWIAYGLYLYLYLGIWLSSSVGVPCLGLNKGLTEQHQGCPRCQSSAAGPLRSSAGSAPHLLMLPWFFFPGPWQCSFHLACTSRPLPTQSVKCWDHSWQHSPLWMEKQVQIPLQWSGSKILWVSVTVLIRVRHCYKELSCWSWSLLSLKDPVTFKIKQGHVVYEASKQVSNQK